MPAHPPFISYAQNREDVVLWRALGHVPDGRYVEVGANHPLDDSVSRAFYDRGWSGLTVEPMPQFAAAHRAERPRDTLVEAVITDEDVDSVVLHEVPGTGLSSIVDDVGARHADEGTEVVDRRVTAHRLDDVLRVNGGLDQTVHFMLVDTEGAEGQVLASVDLTTFRPWVLVIESTAPNSTEQTHDAWEGDLLAAGYRFCLFDGISRFYVAQEHPELEAALSYPACVLDEFVEHRVHRVLGERERLIEEVLQWKATALRRWAQGIVGAGADVTQVSQEADRLRAEIDAIHATLSWRVTTPLRAVRSLSRR